MEKKDLIEVFNDTIKKANTIYKEDTDTLLDRTDVYIEEKLHNIKVQDLKVDSEVIITKNDTISEVIEQSKNTKAHIAALNFADAVCPGGGVKSGVITQEEDLCRCSNLYPSISQNYCYNEFYKKNISNYYNTYRLIYSSDVLILKDYHYCDLEKPIQCDIITSPAPIVGCATDDFILQKMKDIINIAYLKGVDTLILGMWGCGAFGNDEEQFAELFAKAIKESNSIPKIIFANYCRNSNTWDLFYNAFYTEYHQQKTTK